MNEVIKNKKKSEILAEELSKLDYGTVIKHSQIAEMIQEDYGSSKYGSTVAKARKILLSQYHKEIECIRGDGYRLVSPDGFVDHSLRHFKRGFNEIQRATNTLKHAPVNDMTEEGRTVYRRVYDRTVTLNAAMKGATVELKTLSVKQHPMMLSNMKNN